MNENADWHKNQIRIVAPLINWVSRFIDTCPLMHGRNEEIYNICGGWWWSVSVAVCGEFLGPPLHQLASILL
jgi:hypothetical protein